MTQSGLSKDGCKISCYPVQEDRFAVIARFEAVYETMEMLKFKHYFEVFT